MTWIRKDPADYIENCIGTQEVPDFYGKSKVPSSPTSTLPGSSEKIYVLTQRALNLEQLFHPDDAKLVTPAEDGYGYGLKTRGTCRVLGLEKLTAGIRW
jgi:hypothetical protein